MKLKIIGILLIAFALIFGGIYGYTYFSETYNTSPQAIDNREKEAREIAEKAKEEYLKNSANILIEPIAKDSEDIIIDDIEELESIDEIVTVTVKQPKVRVVENDLVAKLTIPACDMEVLVYENEEDDYYLRRDANGKSSTHGEIYTNCYDCKAPVIWGHHMKDGTMFADLDCIYVGASVTLEDIGYLNDETRNYTVSEIKNNVPAYKVWDELGEVEDGLVLITCSYGVKDSRLIVICTEDPAE